MLRPLPGVSGEAQSFSLGDNSTAGAFEVAPRPDDTNIRLAISRREKGEIQMVLSGNKYPEVFTVVPGFEDVVGEPFGKGFAG